MTKIIFLAAILMGGFAHAEIYKCEVSQLNGSAPSERSYIAFDPDRVLLNINRGNGPETLLGVDSIHMIDVDAVCV